MLITEFIVQGIRQFAEMRRFSFGSGYNAIFSAPDGRVDILIKTLHAVFYQPSFDGRRNDLVEPGAGTCRAGVTLVGRDGRRYRVLRDFMAGAVSLAMDDGSGKFAPVSNQAKEIEQLLGAQVGWVSEDIYETLLFTSLSQMPSRRAPSPLQALAPAAGALAQVPGAEPGAMAGAASGAMPGAAPNAMQGAVPNVALGSFFGSAGNYLGEPESSEFAHLSQDEKSAKLQELRDLLQSADATRQMEFELDGLQRRKFEIEDQLRPFRDAARQLDEQRVQLQPFADIEDVPADFQQRLDWFRREQSRREANIETLEKEYRRDLSRRGSGPSTPLLKEPLFTGGLAVGVGAFALGAVLARSVDPSLWTVALVDLAGFGAAAWVLLRRITELEKVSDTARAKRRLEERQERVRKRFELDTTAVRKILHRHSVDPDDLDDLEIRLGQRQEISGRIAEAEQKMEQIRASSDIDARALSEELTQLEEAIAQFEDKLVATGAVHVDMMGLTGQITALERELGADTPKKSEREHLALPEATAAQSPAQAATLAPAPIQNPAQATTLPPAPVAPQDPAQAATLPPGPPAPSGVTQPVGAPAPAPDQPPTTDDDDGSYGGGYGGGGSAGGAGPITQTQADSPPPWCCMSADGGGGEPPGTYGGGGSPSGPPLTVTDLTRDIMEKADSLFCQGIPALGQRIAPRLAQFVAAFTEQRYNQLHFSDRGELSLVEASSGRAVPFLMLATPDRDIAYLCLKMALIEAYASISPLPLVLDDAFAALPELKHPLAQKMLAFLATQIQIVHFTSLPDFAVEGQGRIEL